MTAPNIIDEAIPMTEDELQFFRAGVCLYAPKPGSPAYDNDWYEFYFRDVPRLIATIDALQSESAKRR